MTAKQHPELSAAEWKALMERLVRYAYVLVAKGRWSGVRPSDSWIRERAVDLANEAVTDVVSGVRTWNRERYPDFEDAVRAALESEVSNAKTGSENRGTTATANFVGPDEAVADPRPLADETSADQQLAARAKAAAADEPQLLELLDGVYAGFSRSEIAELLGITGSAYDALRGKLQRRLRKAGITVPYLLALLRGDA